MMTTSRSSSPLVVATGEDPSMLGVHLARLHHRALPELVGEGATAREAAAALLGHLTTEADSLIDRWHRAALDRVAADVRAFTEGCPAPKARRARRTQRVSPPLFRGGLA